MKVRVLNTVKIGSRTVVPWLCLLFLWGTPSIATEKPPRLVLWIVVDSLSSEQLILSRNQLRHGLKRLLDEGAYFPNVVYPYAHTATAPGHATLLTGTTPNRHGVVSNAFVNARGEWENIFLDGKEVAFDDSSGAPSYSPRNLFSETVGDRLRAANRGKSKVISIASKSHASVPMAGRSGTAYWFDAQKGQFTTSSYYLKSLPDWVRTFNSSSRPHYDGATSWGLLNSSTVQLEETVTSNAADWLNMGKTFPHTLKPSSKGRYEAYAASPLFFDTLVDFATTSIEKEALGRDEIPDLLCVSFSAVDWMNHMFGPGSIEVEDSILRFDNVLGRLLAFARKATNGHLLVVLSADHGAAPMPEEVVAERPIGIRVDATKTFQDISSKMLQEYRVDVSAQTNGTHVYLNFGGQTLTEERKTDIRRAWADQLSRHSEVLLALASEDLRSTPDAGGYSELLRRSQHSAHEADVLVVMKPFSLLTHSPNGSFHGSPHAYDSHVPTVFWGRGVKPGRHRQHESILDVAPTVAAAMAVGVPAQAEGRVMISVFEP